MSRPVKERSLIDLLFGCMVAIVGWAYLACGLWFGSVRGWYSRGLYDLAIGAALIWWARQ